MSARKIHRFCCFEFQQVEPKMEEHGRALGDLLDVFTELTAEWKMSVKARV